MKILVTGITGQVGHALMQNLTEHELIGLTRQDCDLTNLDQIRQVIDHYQPQLIINPAAYTKVDQAEDEQELAFKINRDAPKVIAEKAREYNIPFIHFSTDYVFDGLKKTSYYENDQTTPLNVYGASKLAGDEAIKSIGARFYIFRVGWVYSNFGNNFYLTIKKLMNENRELRVVTDQLGTPTSNKFIAENMKKIIANLDNVDSGIFHLAPNDFCSWYEFAEAIIKKTRTNYKIEKLTKIESGEYNFLAKRPKNSVLNTSKVKTSFMLEFDHWSNELNRVISEA